MTNQYSMFILRGSGHARYIKSITASDIDAAFEEMKKCYPAEFEDTRVTEFWVRADYGKEGYRGRMRK
jgi:hypothetical protein